MDIFAGSIPSCLNNIEGLVRDAISSIGKNFGPMDENSLFDLKVVLNEVIINSVRHGNKEDPAKFVTVNVKLEKDLALITVTDEGSGYDLDSICRCQDERQKEADISCVLESGRGIMLARCLCDSITVDGKGSTIVSMRLKREQKG